MIDTATTIAGKKHGLLIRLIGALLAMRLPATEMALFQGLPFLEQPLALPTALPSAGMVILALATGQHFWAEWVRARQPDQ